MSAIANSIQEWIDKADRDLGSAKLIYLHIPHYYDMVAFHCQQAVEKYLKPALVHFEIDFPRSHDLVYLLDLLSSKNVVDQDTYDKAIKLNGFNVEIRYPDKKIF
jgi:HEPN domain-containing protein